METPPVSRELAFLKNGKAAYVTFNMNLKLWAASQKPSENKYSWKNKWRPLSDWKPFWYFLAVGGAEQREKSLFVCRACPPLLYLHSTGWAAWSCPAGWEGWWSSTRVEGCAQSRSRHFSSGGRRPAREESSNGKQVGTHVHSVNTNASGWKQASFHHTDSLISFLSGLESARLCGCQIMVNERGRGG